MPSGGRGIFFMSLPLPAHHLHRHFFNRQLSRNFASYFLLPLNWKMSTLIRLPEIFGKTVKESKVQMNSKIGVSEWYTRRLVFWGLFYSFLAELTIPSYRRNDCSNSVRDDVLVKRLYSMNDLALICEFCLSIQNFY